MEQRTSRLRDRSMGIAGTGIFAVETHDRLTGLYHLRYHRRYRRRSGRTFRILTVFLALYSEESREHSLTVRSILSSSSVSLGAEPSESESFPALMLDRD